MYDTLFVLHALNKLFLVLHFHTRELINPAVDLLTDAVLHLACISGIGLLLLETGTVRSHATLSIVHSLLEGVILPSENIITVLAVTCIVTGA